MGRGYELGADEEQVVAVVLLGRTLSLLCKVVSMKGVLVLVACGSR